MSARRALSFGNGKLEEKDLAINGRSFMLIRKTLGRTLDKLFFYPSKTCSQH